MARAPALLGAFAAAALGALASSVSCDDAASCPGSTCDPITDGTPFDVLDWCQSTGQCLRDGKPVPVCPHADAMPPPACSLGPVDSNETLTFPLSTVGSVLGGRRDLVVVYGDCYKDGEPPLLSDVQVLYDEKPAACVATNPCDPSQPPTEMTCAGIPKSVSRVELSFSYAGAQGMTALRVLMQNTTCSYFCGSPRSSATMAFAP